MELNGNCVSNVIFGDGCLWEITRFIGKCILYTHALPYLTRDHRELRQFKVHVKIFIFTTKHKQENVHIYTSNRITVNLKIFKC